MISAEKATNEESATAPAYSLWQLVKYALRLGAVGFGGPAALVNYMHRDLVEDRKWISESDYKEGLALAQLMHYWAVDDAVRLAKSLRAGLDKTATAKP